MANKTRRLEWIIDWLDLNTSADVVNEVFHDAYHAAFPEYVRHEKLWGAQPVTQAMRDLAAFERNGILERRRIGLGDGLGPGFPKWVWSYTLKENNSDG